MNLIVPQQTFPRGTARTIGKERGDTLAARNRALQDGDVVSVTIRRSDDNGGATLQAFEIPYTRAMRVLDALNYISQHLAPDLAYRWLCGSKMCGTCAVRMNGREVLACWEAVEPSMTIEPLRNLPVVRDLVVDRAPYEQRVANFQPWIERDGDYAGFPEPLTHTEVKHASKALDCISCMSCFSACPVVGLSDVTNFAGPAPLVQLAQTALDARNSPDKVASALSVSGIFNCVSCYKCEEVCPAKIPIVTSVIEPLKTRAVILTPQLAHHALTFRSIILARGRIDPTELVFRVRGLKLLLGLGRALRMLVRRKINPVKTLFGRWSGASSVAARLLRKKDR